MKAGGLILPLASLNTQESTLHITGVEGEVPQGHEHERAGPSTCLPCGNMGKGKMAPLF